MGACLFSEWSELSGRGRRTSTIHIGPTLKGHTHLATLVRSAVESANDSAADCDSTADRPVGMAY